MSHRRPAPGPRPRLTQAILAAVLVVQALFAWAGLAGAGDPFGPLAAREPLGVAVLVGFAAYALAIAAFIAGVMVEAPWLRPLGIAVALGGIVLALLRVAAGEQVDGLLFGIAIDALVVYGLRRPDIRALFPA